MEDFISFKDSLIAGVPQQLLKLRHLLSTYILTTPFFGLCLQGTLLILVLLDTNVTLLLKREAALGHVPESTHDWVTIGAGLVEFGFGALIAWCGQARKNFALSFWLTATAAAGLLVLAFPFKGTPDSTVELCGGEEISSYYKTIGNPEDDPWVPRVAMLCMTAAFCVLARLSLFAHGFVYVDDHEPQHGAYHYGILITIRLSLGLNGVNWLTPSATRDDWWHSHLTLCMLMIMFAILLTLFPRRKVQDKGADGEMVSKEFFSTLGRVLRNKIVVVQSVALAFLSAAVFGFVRFDDDFVEAQFHIETKRQDPRASRQVTNIFRTLVIVFFVMIFRTRFSGRRSDGVKATTSARVGGIVAIATAVPLVVISLLVCNIGDIAGSNAEYGLPVCSMQCGCSADSYGFSPVCTINTTTTYFSPCLAGCKEVEDLNGFLLFSECSCGGGRAARGACSLADCGLVFNIYQLLFALVLSMAGAALLMQGMVIVRSVLTDDKAVALGTSFAVTALLSHIPGYMLYMLISHLSCAYTANGGCLFHFPFLWSMALLSAGFSAASGALSLLTSRLARSIS
ncbi:solute carrier organic anion transporter family member 2B1-like [Cydia strobilella]|uniref:solute carrier organic anion transporter family member 2B1-like n=1 Tax=Cydia strobilella TaxID=1100964 RepID=UPI003004E371